ncbi:MAG: chemotaxis-specific protein-glutamate methyltransferase CheB [Alphaproteobacteria bacterium]
MAGAHDISSADNRPIRVMIVDDSSVARGFLAGFLEGDAGISVVSAVADGQQALQALSQAQPDVIILDLEMPVMDGLTALPQIVKKSPKAQVIVASTLTHENATLAMKCLALGAADCLGKPQSQDMAFADVFRQDLVNRVKLLGQVARGKPLPEQKKTEQAPPPPEPQRLRPARNVFKPEAIAIASSTGGPAALLSFFQGLDGKPLPQPIFVTQHMPPVFTQLLADNIAIGARLTAREATEGEEVRGGVVYIAPGNFHMTIVIDGALKRIRLTRDAPVNFCRPSADPMLESLSTAYQGRVLAMVLTGMGTDGLNGCRKLAQAGGEIYAQDEASSVVWGMPGAVAQAALCNRILPLAEMPAAVRLCALEGDG